MTGILKVDTIQKNNGATPTAKDLGLSITGNIIQVVSAELTSRVAYNNSAFGDIGLSVDITPKFSTSKFLINISFGRLQTTQSNGDHGAAIRLLRNGVDSDLNGVADGSRARSAFTVGGHSYNSDHSLGGYSFTGIDNPNTSSTITYKLQAWNQSSTYPLIINGTSANSDSYQFYTSRTKSVITVMEIAA